MRVHHLNCGRFKPVVGGDWVNHVLLIETDNGLVLVDSGFGTKDAARPQRVGPLRHIIRPVIKNSDTAAYQIEQLGLSCRDVRHIIITHFDVDHTGGLADFPRAKVHTTSAEAFAVTRAVTPKERLRYFGSQLDHHPELVQHDPVGEKWRGFAAAKELDEIAPGILLLSLPGHTRGHAAIAVDAGHRWVLNVGDCIYHPATIDKQRKEPAWLPAMYAINAHNWRQVRENQARLTELAERADPDLLIVCTHSAEHLEHARATQGA
ncbi:MBL fold metallo-hydrolase [Mycobacteroides abscessus]|uniref:MBL fold metallo-hydrolase n=1 Tax=Mycobacteroides abscessus TaxID=36809 RepID=UPI0003101AFE|nr:MBL fold metallo-hydrolase [Mycobacteroides abscessus]